MKKVNTLKAIAIGLLILGANGFADDMADGFQAINEKNYSKAFPIFSNACDNGAATACGVLGLMYAQGNGVDINLEMA